MHTRRSKEYKTDIDRSRNTSMHRQAVRFWRQQGVNRDMPQEEDFRQPEAQVSASTEEARLPPSSSEDRSTTQFKPVRAWWYHTAECSRYSARFYLTALHFTFEADRSRLVRSCTQLDPGGSREETGPQHVLGNCGYRA